MNNFGYIRHTERFFLPLNFESVIFFRVQSKQQQHVQVYDTPWRDVEHRNFDHFRIFFQLRGWTNNPGLFGAPQEGKEK